MDKVSLTTQTARYVGTWKAHEPHGEGTLTYASGDMYKGEWRMGKRHGKGTYTWPTGKQFIGVWVNDACPPGSPQVGKLGGIWATAEDDGARRVEWGPMYVRAHD
jgi:hypothetical protein